MNVSDFPADPSPSATKRMPVGLILAGTILAVIVIASVVSEQARNRRAEAERTKSTYREFQQVMNGYESQFQGRHLSEHEKRQRAAMSLYGQ